MPRLGMDRPTKGPGGERRSRRRRSGTAEDLRHSVMRVKSAMRNSPTQILSTDPTRALAELDRRALEAAGYPEAGQRGGPPAGPHAGRSRFLHVPMAAASRALAALRKLW